MIFVKKGIKKQSGLMIGLFFLVKKCLQFLEVNSIRAGEQSGSGVLACLATRKQKSKLQ